MDNTVGTLQNHCERGIPSAKAQARQRECFSVPITAEFAALFCTARQPEPYNASAAENLSVQWKGCPVQWIPTSVQWKGSPVQWKNQLRAMESWSSQLSCKVTRYMQSHNLQIVWRGREAIPCGDSLLTLQLVFGELAVLLHGGTNQPRRC